MQKKNKYGIICSECKINRLDEIRYTCLTCRNYSICIECEKAYGLKHGHPLLKLRNLKSTNVSNLKSTQKISKGFFYNSEKYINSLVYGKLENFKCRNKTLTFNTKNNSDSIDVAIILENNGKTNWPNPCYLIPKKERSQITGEKVMISNYEIKPNDSIKASIKIDLHNIKVSGSYNSYWELCNQNEEPFGHGINIVINDLFEEKKVKKILLEASKTKGFFRNSIAYIKTLVFGKEFNYICRNKKLSFITKNNKNFINIPLILENNGKKEWSQYFLVPNKEKSQIIGELVKLPKKEVKVNEKIKVTIKINLENISVTGLYNSYWELVDEKNNKIGHGLNILINDKFDDVNKNKQIKPFKFEYRNDFNFICRNKTLNFIIKNTKDTIKIPIILENNGKNRWPQCYLVPNKKKSIIIGDIIKLPDYNIEVGDIIELPVIIKFDNMNYNGLYNSFWELVDEKNNKIGPGINICINLINEEKLITFPFSLESRNDLNFQCKNKNLCFTIKNNDNNIIDSIIFPIILKNNGKNNWPSNCLLVPDKEKSQIIGDKVNIPGIIKSGEEIKVSLKINLNNINTGIYNSQWKLIDTKNFKIGHDINMLINNLCIEYKNDESISIK